MLAKEMFETISNYIEEAVANRDSSTLVDKVKALNLAIEGESNYMDLNCSYTASDGTSIVFSFHSYDPSGPFQNLPDVNKIKLQLISNGNLVSEVSQEFDDKH